MFISKRFDPIKKDILLSLQRNTFYLLENDLT